MIEGVARLVCERLLNQLDDSVLNLLVETTTNNSIVAGTREESISIILDYAENVKTLLERKRIHKNGYRSFTFQETKAKLIRRFSDYIRRRQETGNDHDASTSTEGREADRDSAFLVSDVMPDGSRDISAEFVSWFYPMLNSLNSEVSSREWKSDIFLPGCKFSCVFRNNENEESSTTTCSGPEETRQALENITKQDEFCFNTNDTPSGRKAIMKAPDVAKVGVCGVLYRQLHQGTQSVGRFEQIFEFKLDPCIENSWKIKLSTLIITLSRDTTMPTLSEKVISALRL
ncbi:uncharacterized protein C3orf38 homolog isoform X2 [Clavelina lepadiformis]|uniref:uncharacterized protein C3orf38 homolog isoform X2 n=1 Tax=Clavelina lepadiformis TaxID=159417 RepID=UPI004043925A